MTKSNKKATSIKIDPKLLKKFRIYCIKNETTMTSVLNDYISKLVKKK